MASSSARERFMADSKSLNSGSKKILHSDPQTSKPVNRAKTISNADDPVTLLIPHLDNDETATERKPRANRYDPYSFLENMTLPFEFTNIGKSKAQASKKKHEADAAAAVAAAAVVAAGEKRPLPHCKACTDFKTWMELTAHPKRHMSREEREQKECPLDSELLGRNTWAFLHTMAAYYPEKPSLEQQHNMKKFVSLLSQFYPCHKCASHLREDLKTNTPDTSNNIALSQWFCNLHNSVNVRLGKVEFDCSKVLERWRDGWKDGSCD